MVPFLFSLLAFALSLVQAVPYPKRGMAQVISQCQHDFAYTWDDGPYTHHSAIQDAFDDVNGKTTFFVNGDNWSCIYDPANVAALRRSFEAGHQIASHTWSHPHLTQLTEAQIDVEIERLDEALMKILGVRPKYLRPPYGDIDERTASYIQSKHGKTIVLWSDDSGDSIGGTAQGSYDFYANFASQGPEGGPHMTLSHEVASAGYQAMYMGTVPLLANAGLNLVTVAQCLDTDAYDYIGEYGTRDETWYCGGTWNPNPTSTSTTTPTSTSMSTSSTTSTSTSTTSTAPACVETHIAGDNETCETIEQYYGLPAGAIKLANSFVNCEDIWPWTPLCIPPGGTGPTSTTPTSTMPTSTSTSTSTSSTPTPSCVTTYVSRNNDTCSTIETRFQLPSGAIHAANSFVTCTDIWAGTPLCIPPGGTGASCTQTISSGPNDTCETIGLRHGISAYQVQVWNTFLTCNDIWEHTPVCVNH